MWTHQIKHVTQLLKPIGLAWVGLVIHAVLSAAAQSATPHSNKLSAANADEAALPSYTLRFSDPLTFPIGTKDSLYISDFKCDADGVVYFPFADNSPQPAASETTSQGIGPRMTVAALTPSGGVVRFAPQAVNGYRNVISLLRYFVSDSAVYLLTLADQMDASDNQKTLGRVKIIEVFDHKGMLTRSIPLDPGMNPLNLAALGSGEILIFCLDKLSGEPRLFLLDESGRVESELKLLDRDYYKQIEGAAGAQNGNDKAQEGTALLQVLAAASVLPHGENVLFAPSQIGLPIVELNRHGVVNTINLALPRESTLQSLLLSDDGLLHGVIGTHKPLPKAARVQPEDREPSGFFPTEAVEFYPRDGSIAKRISLGKGLLPVCSIKGRYSFVIPREEDGRLQIVQGTPVSK